MTKREIRRLETIIRRVAHLRDRTHDMILRADFAHIYELLTDKLNAALESSIKRESPRNENVEDGAL